MSNFTAPAPVDETEGTETRYFRLKNYQDTLLAFRVTGYDEARVHPRFPRDGARPTVFADVLVIEGPDRGREFVDVDLTAQYVVPRLSPKVGAVVLGRLVKAESAYFLNDPEPADIADADALVAERSGDVPDEAPF